MLNYYACLMYDLVILVRIDWSTNPAIKILYAYKYVVHVLKATVKSFSHRRC